MANKTWLDQLMKKFPSLTVCDATPSAANANKEPRDALLALLHNSIAVANDPSFTITKRGKTYTPEVCHKVDKGVAEVVLKYCRVMLTLPGGRNALKVPADKLVPVLSELLKYAEAGAFDDQLAAIKSKRIAALAKGTKPGKGKKAA